MDADRQANHLKAYGIAFSALQRGTKGEWLLNYRGGSFLFPDDPWIRKECLVRGVSGEPIADGEAAALRTELASPSSNTELVVLEKAPKIAVYSPGGKQPWDDAVTLVLTYAEIPYDRIYDREILRGDLAQYEWLHLHHEDFTGQYGKFYGAYRHAT
ncbi:MAG: asparagine synthetase B, partial [Schleiferiaceae bacterium]|nr:asparagine synthetase B [Schleiferiaceae bacterium]